MAWAQLDELIASIPSDLRDLLIAVAVTPKGLQIRAPFLA